MAGKKCGYSRGSEVATGAVGSVAAYNRGKGMKPDSALKQGKKEVKEHFKKKK